ncbi:MAG: BTAD domain-containing putative transcriptional regulator, partial [Anaerolineae bacterium]
MSTLRFRCLGPLSIRCGDRELPQPPTQKSQSLLAYLILHRKQPQPRARLAGLFWGDRPEPKARGSLSTSLWHIRHALSDDLVLGDLHTVQFDPSADVWLDVEAFESQASDDHVTSLESAVALYRGPLLDGFYDDWIVNERYRLEALLADALVRLMRVHEDKGDHDAALAAAQRLLRHDRLREEAHRAAMRAYCRLGRRNAALEQYQRCREIVQEELCAEPTAETTEMWRSIREGRFEVPPAREGMLDAVGSRIRREPLRAEQLQTGARSPLDAVAVSPFVGREQELASLEEGWRRARAGQGSLVLISGEAGVGKTRLVEASADRWRWLGARVVWGRCYEFTGGLPYQSVAEALRTVVTALPSGQLADLPAWSLREVARLAPALSDRVDAGSLDPSGDEGAILNSSRAEARDLLG